MKKILCLMLLLGFVLSFFSQILADEIVVNKEGKSILLKSDKTWEFIQPSRVVFNNWNKAGCSFTGL